MLNERKLKILQAIIQDYIETAEPVGSRTLSKKYDLGVSPATIRNDMADLEELGYITQPYTSSGRIPSDKGYRLYVDQFMSLKKLSDFKKDLLELELLNKISEIEQILQYSSKLLSQITNYTTVAVAPQLKESKLKHIQLVPIDSENVLAVLVTDSGMVKKPIIRIDHKVTDSNFETISNYLNDKLYGMPIENIEDSLIEILNNDLKDFSSIVDEIIPEIFQSLDEINNLDMFLNGTMNIFNFPEYNDILKAKSFLEFLEEKQLLSNLITSFNNEGLNISIGSENVYKEAKDCSLITATYKIDNKTLGWLSVIGPTRMEYSNVVSVMAEASKFINDLFKNRYR